MVSERRFDLGDGLGGIARQDGHIGHVRYDRLPDFDVARGVRLVPTVFAFERRRLARAREDRLRLGVVQQIADPGGTLLVRVKTVAVQFVIDVVEFFAACLIRVALRPRPIAQFVLGGIGYAGVGFAPEQTVGEQYLRVGDLSFVLRRP